MSSSSSTSTGVLDYLRSSLPRSTLLELYANASYGRFVCRAVLQTLPEMEQQVVMRLLACSFPKEGVRVWTKQENLDYLNDLYSWGILSQTATDVVMQPEFAKGLNASITSLESSPWPSVSPIQLQAAAQEHNEVYKQVTLDDLESYTQDRWDAVLHKLVETPNYSNEPPPAVVQFLLQTGLMQTDPDYTGNDDDDDAPLVITSKGYDFMLQDTHQQVWHFVSQYLESLKGHKKHKELLQEALLFLICLSYCRLGDAYAASSLSKDGRELIKDLALFGLLYVQKIGKSNYFYPTRVALQLVQETSAQNSLWALSTASLQNALEHPRPHDSSHLAIIVQTNFQLCAYTTSELHVSMLGLFCHVDTIRRLPNVVFMIMTRDSVKSAFALGIQAKQILSFLEKHAHVQLRKSGMSAVPANVRDQIWLWDREQRRIRWTKVYTHQCLMEGEFEAVRQYAADKNALAWSSVTQNQILVDYAQAEKVENFCQKWRAKTAARQAEE